MTSGDILANLTILPQSILDHTLVTGSQDKLLIIWDLETTKMIFKIDVHSDTINDIKMKV